jgi:protein SHQ1
MLRLPRKECWQFTWLYLTSDSLSFTDLATPLQMHNLYLTLISLLFSYVYETRTTQCDPTPESAWTLCSLTPAFTALDPAPYHGPSPSSSSPSMFTITEINATFVNSYRRSLSFPLYRSWALAECCRQDVAQILGQGKRLVARCLLAMKDILDHHEAYYVYSKIWVDDFCTWIQANAR